MFNYGTIHNFLLTLVKHIHFMLLEVGGMVNMMVNTLAVAKCCLVL